MNYIELIRAFWRSHEEHSFTTTEVAVYFYLLEVCNICQWKNPFKRNNAKIEADLSISFNTLKNARNRLQQAALITFKTTNGSPNVLYTLSNFDKVTAKVGVEVINEVTAEVGVEVLPTKDKLNINETKLIESSAEDSLPAGLQQTSASVNREKDTPPSSAAPPQIDYRDMVTFFNSVTKGVFGTIRYPLSKKRQDSVRARIREYGKEAFAEMIRKAAASDFLKGNSKRGFKATFDWMILPSNFSKIIEGNYDNKTSESGRDNSLADAKLMENIAAGIGRGYDEFTRKNGGRS